MLASTQRGSLFVLRKGDEDAYPCDLCATQTLGRQRKRSASQWSLALTPGIFLWLLHEIVAQRLIERRGDGEPRNGRHRTRRRDVRRRAASSGPQAADRQRAWRRSWWEADRGRQTAGGRQLHRGSTTASPEGRAQRYLVRAGRGRRVAW